MSTIRDLAEEHWQGRGDLVHAHHPVQPVHVHEPDGSVRTASEEIADGLLTFKSIASVNAVDTADGIVMLDTGGQFDRQNVYDAVRAWRPTAPVAAAVYSHHHVDHVLGTALFDAEARDQGWDDFVGQSMSHPCTSQEYVCIVTVRGDCAVELSPRGGVIALLLE